MSGKAHLNQHFQKSTLNLFPIFFFPYENRSYLVLAGKTQGDTAEWLLNVLIALAAYYSIL